MEGMGKLERARAKDLPEYKLGGFKLKPKVAFGGVLPHITSKLEPLPIRSKLHLQLHQEYLDEKQMKIDEREEFYQTWRKQEAEKKEKIQLRKQQMEQELLEEAEAEELTNEQKVEEDKADS